MFGYIYETTNLINNKKYIGKHKSNKFDKFYLGSGTYIKNAIEKYGKENFEVKILEKINNISDNDLGLKYLAEREIYYIKKYNAVKDNDYYNMSYGNESEGWYGLNQARRENPEYYKEHHWSKTGNYDQHNRIYTEREIENFKNNHWSKLGYSIWNKGKKIPKEQQTESQKNYGSLCKGTIWINKNNKNKRINPKDLNFYISEGWNKGRILSETHIENMKGRIPWNKGKKLAIIDK